MAISFFIYILLPMILIVTAGFICGLLFIWLMFGDIIQKKAVSLHRRYIWRRYFKGREQYWA